MVNSVERDGRRRFKEPFSSISHLFGAVAAVPVTVLLIYFSDGAARVASFAVFGAALFLLYAASGIYHAVAAEKPSKVLRKLDHMMIFVLIAGTYTPICVVALKGAWGVSLLCVIWGLAVLGMLLMGVWIKLPRWVSAVIYVLMGWVAVAAFAPLSQAISGKGTNTLILGGVFYTIGAVIYSLGYVKKLRDILPKQFGFHEIFHLFVLAGSVCHILLMFKFLL